MTRATSVEARASASDFLRPAPSAIATHVFKAGALTIGFHPVIGLPLASQAAR